MTKNRKMLILASPLILLASIADSIRECIKDIKVRWRYFDDDNGKLQCKNTCNKNGPIYRENQWLICNDCYPR